MEQTTYEQAAEWIAKKTADVSSSQYGRNDFAGKQALLELSALQTAIVDYNNTIQRVLDKTDDNDKKASLQKSYDSLKALSENKVLGSEVIVAVTSLENNCSRVSRELDRNALHLSREAQKHANQKQEEKKQAAGVDNLFGFIASVSQDAVFGLRDNWNWIVQLVKCVDIHLKNAADYHQFFHEIDQTEPWLLQDMLKLSQTLDSYNLSGSEDEAKKLLDELMGVTVMLRQWEARVNRIWETAVRLRPLPLRIDGVQQPTPATIICDYTTSEITVREAEEVLLIENADSRHWKVRNGRGQEALVPAVIVLIAGPDAGVIEAAVRLRLELLAAWTNTVKRIGMRIIEYLILVFKPDYTTKEISVLTSVRNLDKNSLLHMLSFIEETLQKHWADHDGFIALQERILALRMILEETGEGTGGENDELYKKLLLQITTLAQIIELYQTMFGDWEKNKVSVEASRQPELMLIVDKWEQLQFVSREFFAKFWKTSLPLNDGEALAGLRQFTLDGEEFEDALRTGSSPPKLLTLHSTDTSDGELLVFDVPDIVDPSLIESTDVDGGRHETSTVTFTTTFNTALLSSQSNIGRTGNGSGTSEEGFDETSGRTVVSVNVGGDASGSGSGNSGGGDRGRRVINIANISVLGSAQRGGSGGNGEEGSFEEGFEEIRETTLRQSQSSEQEGTDFGVATERKTAETEQLMAAEVEEKKTFTIRAVVNPADGSEIAMQKAIMLGILRPNEGLYVNTITGEKKPIPVAMNEGLIKVTFTTTKRSEEKTSSVGIITVKTIREAARPYVIISARDTRTSTDLNVSDATKAGILVEKHGTYIDRTNGRRYLISEAAEAGLAKIEYTGPASEPEVIAKTYAVRAVVDRRQKKTITFHEAVRRGIIDRESGAFTDTQTGDKMYVGDAIMRGFLKARIIEDAGGLNIDPENRMVIDKTEKIRKRLLKPLGVISAFKMAAAAAASSSPAKKN